MPLIKSCSVKAFSKNVSTEIRAGREQAQSVAIAFSTLRRACGVKDTGKRLSPKEIVARGGGKKEAVEDGFAAMVGMTEQEATDFLRRQELVQELRQELNE